MAWVVSRSAASQKARTSSADASYDSSSKNSRSESTNTDYFADTPVKSLRKRTMRQEHPYKTDRVEHDLARRGLKASDSDLAEKVHDTLRPRLKKESFEPTRKRAKKQKLLASPASTNSESTTATDVIARTRFSELDAASVPVKLDMTSVSELFDRLEKTWHAVLEERKLTRCMVSFSWLDEDDRIWLFRNDDGTAFEELMKKAAHTLRANNKEVITILIQV